MMLGVRHREEGSFLLLIMSMSVQEAKQTTDGVLLEEKACNVGTAEIHSLASYVSFALSCEWRGKTGIILYDRTFVFF